MWDINQLTCSVVRWLRQSSGTYSITHIVDGKKGFAQAGCLSEPTKITNAGRFDIEVFDDDRRRAGRIYLAGRRFEPGRGQPLGPRRAADGTYVDNVEDTPTQYNPDGTSLSLQPLDNLSGGPVRALATRITDYDEVVGSSFAGQTDTGVDIEHAVRWNSDGTVVDLNNCHGRCGLH